ncbi:MAG: MBL fold metallo-hydrolase, partial [Desulfomonile tiedjei]|nr:MBL fold metallo-hydrolase [Desulfomonile tiedjei]
MIKPSASKSAAGDILKEPKRLSVNEKLALINLIEEGARLGSANSPIVADLFHDLGDLVNATVSGATIDRLKSDRSSNGFKVFEINAESGENLGRLNMMYLKKPIPCYYLVYVEVAVPFRKKGLGNRILEVFRDFLIEKSAVGILDNIIPEEDPTFDIYTKLEWQPIEAVIGTPTVNGDGVYMVYIPPSLAGKDLRDPVLKLVHHIKRKRPHIDMRDNELMVKRTIEEFKELYSALLGYFENTIKAGENDPLMRFMFTRFVTKLLGFRRRIARLLGYTGGESLEQIELDPKVRALPIQSYAPKELATNPLFQSGDKELWLHLPEALKNNPARTIEALPNYRRPNLTAWLDNIGAPQSHAMTIGDLMDLGFDPTRLKEITIGDKEYIFERMQDRMLPQLEQRKLILNRIAAHAAGKRIRNSVVHTNPPMLVLRG